MSLAQSVPFLTPVPRTVPGYHERVRQPTDLATIGEQVDAYKFKAVQDFVLEIVRMKCNAEQYWGADHAYAAAGRHLLAVATTEVRAKR